MPRLLTRTLACARRNTVSLLALFFAVGAGGGYALAAANTRTIHGCVNQRTHALYIQNRCGHGQRSLVWNQRGPQGRKGATGPAPSYAFAGVDYNGSLFQLGQGISVQHVGTGVYQVTATASDCANASNVPTVTVTQRGSPSVPPPPSGSVPLAWIEDLPAAATFTVHTGFQEASSFTPADLRFDVEDSCEPLRR